jgi:hypothetical protein
MKNKHLVLLFVLTLLVGLAVRKAPWRDSTFFQRNLLKIDTAEVQQIQIALPAQPTLYLLRGDAAWTAEQASRSVVVSPEMVRQILEVLAELRSVRIEKSKMPDTLGFVPGFAIQVTTIQSNKRQESFSIGQEILENAQAGTYVELPKHGGIYLVNKHLRKLFSLSLEHFRNTGIAQFSPEKVRAFTIFGHDADSLHGHKQAGTRQWINSDSSQIYPDDRVQNWLIKLQQLKGLAFADLFDESQANETMNTEIQLFLEAETMPLTLKIYHVKHGHLPEELSEKRTARRNICPYVIQSSQNPLNYFEIPDTVLLQQICQPF